MINESTGREKKDNAPLDLLLDRPVTLHRNFGDRNVIVLPELLQPVPSLELGSASETSLWKE